MFFDNWQGLLRVLVVGTASYVALVAMLRVAGKRTLSKLNAFDLVVTVALGSTLATVLLTKDVALAEGLLAFALLIVLQFAVAWLQSRSPTFNRLVSAEPTLLYYRGQFLRAALRRQRLTEGEIRTAVRQKGLASLDDVEAVVLESGADLSVVTRGSPPTAMQDVPGADAAG